MAGVAASGNNGQIALAATVVGEETNLITIKAVIDPAGATGVNTVSVSGNDITLLLKNDGAGNITSTNAEQLASLTGSASARRLVTAALAANATGANTGAAWTGSGGVAVALAAGADGTYGYDDLAGATGDGWTLTNVTPSTSGQGSAFDVLERDFEGRKVRVQAAAATGATTVVKSAKTWMKRQAKQGNPRPSTSTPYVV